MCIRPELPNIRQDIIFYCIDLFFPTILWQFIPLRSKFAKDWVIWYCLFCLRARFLALVVWINSFQNQEGGCVLRVWIVETNRFVQSFKTVQRNSTESSIHGSKNWAIPMKGTCVIINGWIVHLEEKFLYGNTWGISLGCVKRNGT